LNYRHLGTRTKSSSAHLRELCENLLLDPAFARDESDKGDEIEHGFADFPERFEDRYAEKMERNQRQ